VDGHGYSAGLAGDDISPLARVMCLAQTMEVFWQQRGPQAAGAVARERRATWFDPALSARRSYREAMDVDAVLRVMGREAGTRLDAVAFGALEAWLPSHAADWLADAA
jgi:HD-GYP domain-containing protein (c-di-GMP phosphodiesterase class II)